jgi:spore coat polysaccharide biosynthesis protein SpsF
MTIPAFITVRSTSTRLPQKCFLPFGKFSVIEHIIQRAKHYDLEPIVCTTTLSSDDAIVDIARKCGVEVYRGPVANKLLRWSGCCDFFGIEAFHSLDADDPFFCGEEIKRSFSLLQSGFDMVAPSPSSASGGATVGYSLTADIVSRSCEGLDEGTDTEMMWSYVERVFGLQKISLSDPDYGIVRARMTLDYNEDYILLEAVRLILGSMASRHDIAALFKKNPDLEKINAHKNEEWARNQIKKSFT